MEQIINLLTSPDVQFVLVGVIIMQTTAIAILWRRQNQLIDQLLQVERAVIVTSDRLSEAAG